MCDKFFESVGLPEEALFCGGGSLNVIHQLGEKVEGGFLSHFMLTQFFRKYSSLEDNDARALLILTQHSKHHWVSVGSKLGTNVAALQEKGALVIVDGLKEAYKGLKLQEEASITFGRNPGDLFSQWEEIIQSFRQAGSKRILVIIEDVTNFLDGESEMSNCEKNVLEMLLKLRALSIRCDEENKCSLAITSLVQSPDSGVLDCVEQSRFAKTVSQVLPSVLLEVSPLGTGFSATVTGFLKVFYKPKQDGRNTKVEDRFIKTYHFKLDGNGARVTPL